MKLYAFTRSNIPRALNYEKESTETKRLTSRKEKLLEANLNANPENSEDNSTLKRRNGSIRPEGDRNQLEKSKPWIRKNDKESACPSYSKFLYFFFAPTLVYRDYYPRYCI